MSMNEIMSAAVPNIVCLFLGLSLQVFWFFARADVEVYRLVFEDFHHRAAERWLFLGQSNLEVGFPEKGVWRGGKVETIPSLCGR